MNVRRRRVTNSSLVLGALLLVAFVARSTFSSGGGSSPDRAFFGSTPGLPRLRPLTFATWPTYITDFAAHGFPWNSVGNGTSGLAPASFDNESFAASHVRLVHGAAEIAATYGSTRHGYSWTSGVVCSYGTTAFDGGFLDVTATLPTMVAGAWPAIWMLPGPTDPDRDEIDIFEGGLTLHNDNPNYNFAGTVRTDGGKVGGPIDVGQNLAQGVHNFGIDWVPGRSITWYLDGSPIQEVTSRQIRIPSKPMVLVMDLQVANESAAGWHTVASGRGPGTYRMRILGVHYNPDWHVGGNARVNRQAAG